MPPKLRRLSGRDVVAIFRGFRFSLFSTRGSHAKLRRITEEGEKQTIVVPLHDELDRGTLRAIFRQACRFVPETELRRHFYTG